MKIEDIIYACCNCHSIRRDGEYHQVGEAVYQGLLKTGDVSHGYCPPCFEKEIGKLRRQNNDKK